MYIDYYAILLRANNFAYREDSCMCIDSRSTAPVNTFCPITSLQRGISWEFKKVPESVQERLPDNDISKSPNTTINVIKWFGRKCCLPSLPVVLWHCGLCACACCQKSACQLYDNIYLTGPTIQMTGGRGKGRSSYHDNIMRILPFGTHLRNEKDKQADTGWDWDRISSRGTDPPKTEKNLRAFSK